MSAISTPSFRTYASVQAMGGYVVVCGCFGLLWVALGCGEVKATAESDASSNVADAGTIDASGPDAGPTCPLGAICEDNLNYAFVTSTNKPGNEIGGLIGADMLCANLAQTAGLPGQYVAWLSSSTVDARDRLEDASGWIRRDRRPFALSRSDLLSGQIIHPLSLDENGVTRHVDVATNTRFDGTRREQGQYAACDDWNGSQDVHEAGRSSETSNGWTSFDEHSCADNMHLYCLGVNHNNPVELPETSGFRRAWLSTTALAGGTGLSVMDAICTSEGDVLGVDSALAFVATTTESAVDRLDLAGPTWVRPDNAVLWLETIDIASKPPLAAINLSNLGSVSNDSSAVVWTGAETPTALALPGDNCQDWSSNSDLSRGLRGIPSSLLDYFFLTTQLFACASEFHFYCFEE